MSPTFNIYCTASVVIRGGSVYKNGELLLQNTPSDGTDFLRALYDKIGVAYPKFFKMDSLCKLAWTGAELLQKDTNFVDGYTPERKAIALCNRSSSLDTDIKHAESITSADAYFPSPAVFVYTLPNITIGEICIRQKIQGSTSFYIFEAFDADFLWKHTRTLFETSRTDAAIIGTADWLGDEYEACLMLVEKNGNEARILTPELIKTIYTSLNPE